jgi:sulfate/thiosulfate transport system permease protein
MSARIVMRGIALSYLSLIIIFPVAIVLWRTFEDGLTPVIEALTEPNALTAIWLTIVIALIAVPLNTVFGVLCALVLVRHDFRGKAILNAAIDLPLGISPVVIGLALIIVYGRNGWFGGWLLDHGIQVIFSTPGMVIATIFVSLPFVVREVMPVLREVGTDQEQAASTLGAGPLQTFRHITLPSIQAGIGYGVVLTTARAIGEFGAVSIVSGKIAGRTETMTLYAEDRFQAFDLQAAYALTVVMALIAFATLIAMNVLEQKRGN